MSAQSNDGFCDDESVRGHLMLTNCLMDEVTRPAIERALKADQLLWLDLEETGDETLALLREVFGIHPLAVEDVKEFGQRPKIEDYEGFVSLVAYGARELGQPLVEVHCRPPGAWSRSTGCWTCWWTPCSRTCPRSTTASTSCRRRSSPGRGTSSSPTCSC
jgi:hypothetical protein